MSHVMLMMIKFVCGGEFSRKKKEHILLYNYILYRLQNF
jgi:hypothetical protein